MLWKSLSCGTAKILSMKYRTEKDSLGNVEVPEDAYYGAQTQRALDLYKISGSTLPLTFFRAYVLIKRAAASANMSTQRLDSKKGQAVLKSCDEILKGKLTENFVVDAFQAGAGTSTNMNINEVIANRATEILGGKKGDYVVHPNDDVNMAQSTNDTFHTAIHLSAVSAVDGLLKAASRLQKALEKKEKELNRVVKSGRTHLMDAVPITLGQEFSGYAAALGKDIKRLDSARDSLLEINIGGTAVGTGLNAEPKYMKNVLKEINKLTKEKFRQPDNFFEATQNMGAVVETSSALRSLALDLVKISSDMRLMAMLEEIELPAVQPGSSIMPGKVNPSVAEMVGMVGYQVLGNDAAIAHACAASQLELNVMMPVAAKNLLESATILTNSCTAFDDNCISGIKANEEIIKQNLEKNASVVTALTPFIGYEKAAEAVRISRETRKPVRTVLLEMRILSGKELDNILNFAEMTRPGVQRKNE